MEENKMTGRELDELLSSMAEETPEMPADFHQAWTNRIHQEARKKQGKGSAQRIRLLSAAAAFVFLIGGTLIYRSVRPVNRLNGVAAGGGSAAAVLNSVKTEAAFQSEAAEDVPDAAAEDRAGENALYAGALTDGAAEAPALQAELEEYAEETVLIPEMAMAQTEETETAAESAKEARTAAPVPLATGAPVPTPIAADAGVPAREEGGRGREQPESGEGFAAGFLRDMGDFVLWVLPWAAGACAVGAGAAWILRSRKKKTE